MKTLDLRVIDGLELPLEHQALLRPGEPISDLDGASHVLPRFFYEIPSWEFARETCLSEHFSLAELMSVDCREAELLLKTFPHYVPCGLSILARYLEEFRSKAGGAVFVSTNGGYRSPAHRLRKTVSPHAWGSAANIYRVGDVYLDNQKEIERYADIARSIGAEVFAKPYGHGPHETDDHLHIDIGYVSLVPRYCSETARLSRE